MKDPRIELCGVLRLTGHPANGLARPKYLEETGK
jgi:hypothetical protein